MQNITTKQMQEILAANPDAQFIDVRERDEYAEVHALGTKNLPMSELVDHLHEIDTAEDVYIICRSGGRSERVAQYLEQAQGAEPEHVYNILGGTIDWVEQDLPRQ